jgi:hypothetical protein
MTFDGSRVSLHVKKHGGKKRAKKSKRYEGKGKDEL